MLACLWKGHRTQISPHVSLKTLHLFFFSFSFFLFFKPALRHASNMDVMSVMLQEYHSVRMYNHCGTAALQIEGRPIRETHLWLHASPFGPVDNNSFLPLFFFFFSKEVKCTVYYDGAFCFLGSFLLCCSFLHVSFLILPIFLFFCSSSVCPFTV